MTPERRSYMQDYSQRVFGGLAIEVGTLGGFSGIWIARGLAPNGRLITIEPEPKHAAFARRQFEPAGVADRVELREGVMIGRRLEA
jgi:predicted O-methyltransferase YrrM